MRVTRTTRTVTDPVTVNADQLREGDVLPGGYRVTRVEDKGLVVHVTYRNPRHRRLETAHMEHDRKVRVNRG